GLCIGSLLALLLKNYPDFLKRNSPLIVFIIASINLGFYFYNIQHSFSMPYLAFVGYTTFAVLFGILVYEGVIGKSKFVQFLFNNHPLKFFGKISYGLYVWHWPVYILFFDYSKKWIIQKNIVSLHLAELGSAFFVTIIAVVISVLSYHYFEKPFLKLKNKFS
ncbi:MAG: acyltransferase family protein, partial [Chitinophagaceae bacterium]